MERGTKIALGGLAGIAGWALLTAVSESDASAKPTIPASDCSSDAECLGKRRAAPANSKVSAVVAAARLTSDPSIAATAQTGTDWVTGQRIAGMVVVTEVGPVGLGEGAVILALEPPNADALTAGGLFRRVD